MEDAPTVGTLLIMLAIRTIPERIFKRMKAQ